MSENINTNEITEVETTATEVVAAAETVEAVTTSTNEENTSQSKSERLLDSLAETPPTNGKRIYQNKTARLLNNFAFAGILLAIVSLGFQCYLSITSYVQQMAPVGVAVLYTIVSVLTPLFAMLAACGLFKFFAEVVELLDRNGKN